MPQLRRSGNDSRYSTSTAAIQRAARRQWGVLSLQQLVSLGYNRMAVSRLTARGYLLRLYPGVYAVGHEPLRVEGRLLAALLHAGDGSALSHTTAAWWWKLIDTAPTTIHLATPNRPSPAMRLKIHRPRQIEAVRERGLCVTTVERTLLDLASWQRTTLREALAQADHLNRLDLPPTARQLRGQPGGRALRQALDHHLPQLATTESELEVRFLLLVEKAGLPVPEVQVWIEGFRSTPSFEATSSWSSSTATPRTPTRSRTRPTGVASSPSEPPATRRPLHVGAGHSAT